MRVRSCLIALVLLGILRLAAAQQEGHESHPMAPGIGNKLLVKVAEEAATFAVGGASVWLLTIAGNRFRTRRAKSLFRPFLTKDLVIVVGCFKEEFREWDPAGLLGVGDAFALEELKNLLSRMGVKEPKVAFADRILSNADDLKCPIILLGGPDANAVTRDLGMRIRSGFRFGDPSHNNVAFSDVAAVPERRFRPSVEDGSGVDYGLILRAPNPIAENQPMLIMAGAFGYGTWATVRLLASPAFHKSSKRILRRPFECLIETEVIGDTPQLTTVVGLRNLGTA